MKESESSPFVRDDARASTAWSARSCHSSTTSISAMCTGELRVGEAVVGPLHAGQQRLHAVAHRQSALAGADEQAGEAHLSDLGVGGGGSARQVTERGRQ